VLASIPIESIGESSDLVHDSRLGDEWDDLSVPGTPWYVNCQVRERTCTCVCSVLRGRRTRVRACTIGPLERAAKATR